METITIEVEKNFGRFVYGALAAAYRKSGEPEKARDCLEKANAVRRELALEHAEKRVQGFVGSGKAFGISEEDTREILRRIDSGEATKSRKGVWSGLPKVENAEKIAAVIAS